MTDLSQRYSDANQAHPNQGSPMTTTTAPTGNLRHGNKGTRQKLGLGLYLAFLTASVVLTAIVVTMPMPRQTLGLIVLAITICLMMAGIHIAIAMMLPSLIGLWILGGDRTLAFAMESIPETSTASWSLSVIPMFILMGMMLTQSGIAKTIFDAAKQWIGVLPGGLGVATIFAGAGMSAASGSTLGVTYATSRIGIPEMLRANYSAPMATGTVAMAGVLKMLIPPSITVVIYAGIAQTPVGPQLLAGVVPGLILALLFAFLITVRAKFKPEIAPPIDTSSFTWRTRLIATARSWPVFLLLVIIVGGLYSGVTTATESGALAALATILVAAWLNRRDGARAFVKHLAIAMMETVAAVSSLMFLIISVSILSLFISTSGAVQTASNFITALGLSRTAFLLILVLMYVVMGMLMDELAMILLTVPILIPVLAAFDIDLIWFGVFLILLCEVGMVMPPVGLLSFVVHGIAQKPEVNLGHHISLFDVFRGVFWFVVVTIALIVVLIFVPDLATWLPGLMAD